MTSRRPPAAAADPLTPGKIDRAIFDAHRGAINLTINGFFLDYLLRVRRAFRGDIEAAIVLGEVAHHNYLPWVARARQDACRLEALLAQPDQDLRPLPANAQSIAAATGIPRETVRRKLAKLAAQGWLEVRGRAEYFVTDAPGEHFAGFTFELLHLFLGVAEALRAVACAGAAPAPPPPPAVAEEE
ncbi:MAG: helix-turn-helix domain-containing protein [Thermoanaerobaculia bacterium]|nr:helix-turn-helix domain-containing protein [Thermoanaerobaculia bacterium]